MASLKVEQARNDGLMVLYELQTSKPINIIVFLVFTSSNCQNSPDQPWEHIKLDWKGLGDEKAGHFATSQDIFVLKYEFYCLILVII